MNMVSILTSNVVTLTNTTTSSIIATVTHDEMIEHSFYQGLNLFQILYLHITKGLTSMNRYHDNDILHRCILLFTVTSPWILRSFFPINKFSDNYNNIDKKSSTLIRVLYRIKKYQYVFYKHFLLHGLNISIIIYGGNNLVSSQLFRLYWMLLNTAYVFEFFLQTLVKKKHLMQTTMIQIQQLLMIASTVAAIYVLKRVNIIVSILSLILNFINRKQDTMNTMFILIVFIGYNKYLA